MAFESEAVKNARKHVASVQASLDLPNGDLAELIVTRKHTSINLNGSPILVRSDQESEEGVGSRTHVFVSTEDATRKWHRVFFQVHEAQACDHLICPGLPQFAGWNHTHLTGYGYCAPWGKLIRFDTGARAKLTWGGNHIGIHVPVWRDSDAERGIRARFVFQCELPIEELEALCMLVLLRWPSP